MKRIVVLVVVIFCVRASVQAISKDDFLKLPNEKRLEYATVVEISSEYAIPKDEYMSLPLEVKHAIALEQQRERLHYAVSNLGKKQKELDVSKLYDLSMPGDVSHHSERVVTYVTLGGLTENHFKTAKYYYKDYLEWKKSELGESSFVNPRGGDESALSYLVALYSEYNMYKEWNALYADYNEFWWKRYAASECRLLTDAGPDCVGKWLKEAEDYQAYLEEWKEVKRKVKTTKPKPLSVYVQIHEYFYADNTKKVLGALEYYNKHKVKFMIKKAANHRNPVIAKKAKEYLDNWNIPVPEDKKEAQPKTETR